VTCRNAIVTDHALAGLGHSEMAAWLTCNGRHVPSFVRAEFEDEATALAFAEDMAATFPEDEVGVWSSIRVLAAAPWPGRARVAPVERSAA
jgi:hypothetical protein